MSVEPIVYKHSIFQWRPFFFAILLVEFAGTNKNELKLKLRQLAARLEVDELVVITWTHDPAAQMRSYELLAQEFALAANC